MARKPRIEYPGAFYHVICRGNQRQVHGKGLPVVAQLFTTGDEVIGIIAQQLLRHVRGMKDYRVRECWVSM